MLAPELCNWMLKRFSVCVMIYSISVILSDHRVVSIQTGLFTAVAAACVPMLSHRGLRHHALLIRKQEDYVGFASHC